MGIIVNAARQNRARTDRRLWREHHVDPLQPKISPKASIVKEKHENSILDVRIPIPYILEAEIKVYVRARFRRNLTTLLTGPPA